MFTVSWLLLLLMAVAILWPRAVALPIAVLGGWVAISLLVKAYRLRRRHNQ
jgi:ABC-type microcin C transport system permease subunit YejE